MGEIFNKRWESGDRIQYSEEENKNSGYTFMRLPRFEKSELAMTKIFNLKGFS